MAQRILGVNVAVKDIDAAVENYRRILGVEPRAMGPESFAFPGLEGAAFWLDNTVINLITAKSEDTAVAKFLATRGEGIFLVSLVTNDIEEDERTFKERGARFVLEQIATGPFGKVNFIHPKAMNGVQFELFEPPASEL